MKSNENFSDASVEWFYSVRIIVCCGPSDADDLGRPCNSLTAMCFHSGVILSKIV